MTDKRMTQQVLAQRYKDMIGRTYRHFKGGMYKVVDIAVHSESSDILVIYRSVDDSTLVWARPLSMFLSEVDRHKYPLVRQRMRFQEVE